LKSAFFTVVDEDKFEGANRTEYNKAVEDTAVFSGVYKDLSLIKSYMGKELNELTPFWSAEIQPVIGSVYARLRKLSESGATMTKDE
jgi:hypothetical protein